MTLGLSLKLLGILLNLIIILWALYMLIVVR